MSPTAAIFVLAGAALSLLAGAGLLKFDTPYARFHSAGKASPVAFLFVAVGAGIETGWGGTARLVVAGAALVLTLPVGVHLLFRAVHRTTPGDHLCVDELAPAEAADRPAAGAPSTPPGPASMEPPSPTETAS